MEEGEEGWGGSVGETTRLMSGHGLKLFVPEGRLVYRRRRQLGGRGEGGWG